MNLALVPLGVELKALVSQLPEVEKNKHGYVFGKTQFAIGGLGKVNFAINTMRYAQILNPTKLMVFGTCGSLRGQRVSEIVQVKKVIEYDFRSKFQNHPEVENAYESPLESKPVWCASGDQDVLGQGVREQVLSATSADIVTWETAGFFKAAKLLGIPFYEHRVVSDLADNMDLDSFKKQAQESMQVLSSKALSAGLFD